MPRDLTAAILRKSVSSMREGAPRCSGCRRTLMAGELLHTLPSGGPLCSLCIATLPDADRESARAERVHASERHIAAVPRAA